MDKIVIFKEFGKLKLTSESNYNSKIMDASAVTDCDGFNSFEEIRDWFIKWCNSDLEQFIDKTN